MTDPQTMHALEGAPYLAVDIIPDTGGRGDFVLDVSELDGPDLLGYDMTDADSSGWLNIVCTVLEVELRRGVTRLQGALTRAEAGQCTVTVSDTDRTLDPTLNGDAVHKNTPFRLRAWGYDAANGMARWDAILFTGKLDDLAVQYFPDDPPTVTLTALDLIGDLVAWKSVGRDAPGVGAGDVLLGRVNRQLLEMGLDPGLYVSPDSDPGGNYLATLPATQLAESWKVITDAQDAELGRVWVDALNHLVVRGRFSELSGPVRGTLTDVHGTATLGVHCCVADASIVYGTELLANRVVAARRVESGQTSAVVQLDDEYSQARYGLHGVESRSLELETDGQLQQWAQAMIMASTEPELRVDQVVPDPANWTPSWPAVCATDLGDRWLFQLHPAVGPMISRALGVLGLQLTVTPEVWDLTWLTTRAPTPDGGSTNGWFVLDVSSLDGGDLLAPYGGLPG